MQVYSSVRKTNWKLILTLANEKYCDMGGKLH